jgi:hypothetical protein
MTELAQPLAGAPADAGGETSVSSDDAPSFSELVYAHFDWWHALREHRSARSANAAYRRLLREFEHVHGRIVQAYWCSHLESAVALTERTSGVRGHRKQLHFYRESDWATKDYPEVAAALHRCDELAVRAKTVLTGVRQRICLQLIVAAAAHLLSLVDERTTHIDDAHAEVALKQELAALEDADAYYKQAANGQAQIVYFAGMVAVAVAVAAVAGIWIAFDYMTPLAALIAGSVGAVVSVIQRINAGQFELDYDVGRPYAFFLGGLRPLIGGSLALVISFAFSGGLLHLPVASGDPDAKRLALLVVAFVAGFSERWAQDALATTVSVPAPKQ